MIKRPELPSEERNQKSNRGAYVPPRNARLRKGVHQCRCNKRNCQARKTLKQHPELYMVPPKCPIPGCEGKLVVDWYRTNGGPKDRAPECTDPTCPLERSYFEKTGVLLRKHRVDNKGCINYEGWVLERALIDSKHSPKKEDSEEPPF